MKRVRIFFLARFLCFEMFFGFIFGGKHTFQQNQPLEKGIHVSHGIPGNACIKLQQPLGGQGAPCVFDLRCLPSARRSSVDVMLWQVQVDEASFEVQEITIALNTNHWKKSFLTSQKKRDIGHEQ